MADACSNPPTAEGEQYLPYIAKVENSHRSVYTVNPIRSNTKEEKGGAGGGTVDRMLTKNYIKPV